MRYHDILLHLADDKRSAEKTQVALALAAKFKAKVTALYTLPFPNQLYYMGEYVPPTYFQQQMDEARDTAMTARKAFEAAAQREGITADWIESDRLPVETLEVHGRIFDVAVVGQPDPNQDMLAPVAPGTTALPADLALTLGRPVIVVPYAGTYPALGKTIMIAWNGSKEATRAVHDAMPLLQAAKKVIIFGINPGMAEQASAEALVKHLARYDVVAELRHTTADGIEAGEALLSALSDYGVDLLVMGAYGHSRLREMVFGGVTETVLRSMTAPALLSN